MANQTNPNPMEDGVNFLLYCWTMLSVLMICSAVDNIPAGGSISDGGTLVSPDGSFELGFFDPGNSRRYLGIWYKKISTRTVVWVANRDVPLNDTSGSLQLTSGGILVLSNGTKGNATTIWFSNSSQAPTETPVARLLDTGNLVIFTGSDILWQSFDYMGDTLLPGMKLGRNLVTGHDNYFTSWKSSTDPSSGNYTNKLDPHGYAQLFQRDGTEIQFRSGPWNGLRFSGLPYLKPNSLYSFEFVYNDDEIYYKYELVNSSVVSRMVYSTTGSLQRLTWVNRIQEWTLYNTAQIDNCDMFSLCGAYGSCNINDSPLCGCLRGFDPKFPSDWVSGDWSNGCVRKTELNCGDGEGFVKVQNVKLPDTRTSWFNRTMDLKECEKECLKNCSCTAYSSLNISGGSGCLIWFNELIDIRQYSEDGQDLYIRLAASDLDSNGKMNLRVRITVVVIIAVAVVLGMSYLLLVLIGRRHRLRVIENQQRGAYNDNDNDLELPLFSFDIIAKATNDFSNMNKIGEGGYGPVFWGKLRDGQEIAVKRLSRESSQGVVQFKNEVLLIAKLQHRNLVKLLGCCIQGEDKMLIYEYMPHKSLDSFIFDREGKSSLLDWPQRRKIINGIARGLLYLHQDSRLRIIHRDLKASNILLDYEMNAKISDFGMAKGFRGDETAANTGRVVGTYGYMSPEYAVDGIFSVKSDVFSFGVLMLEIISGKRNRGFSHPDHSLNLLGHSWKLYKVGQSNVMMDIQVSDSCDIADVSRFIQVGLLCVQQNPEDRPNMASVVLMLSSEIALPEPREPGFFTERRPHAIGDDDSSSNQMTMTMLTAR
ncbi:hypothetical protein SAY87_004118 [Trapa incisa]|uniref:Receptor-like serine/threonine-protein kinase n=1 Tax=Trapa incisa TaxID=236973 RepID=A0AAN7JN90_9MYRT|nr:hypothetical protein SAY87_004118 [Trapa incisa]